MKRIASPSWLLNIMMAAISNNHIVVIFLALLELLRLLNHVPFTTEWYEKQQVKLIFKAHEQRRFWNFWDKFQRIQIPPLGVVHFIFKPAYPVGVFSLLWEEMFRTLQQKIPECFVPSPWPLENVLYPFFGKSTKCFVPI